MPTSYSTLLNESLLKKPKLSPSCSLFVKIIFSKDFISTVSSISGILMLAVVSSLYSNHILFCLNIYKFYEVFINCVCNFHCQYSNLKIGSSATRDTW